MRVYRSWLLVLAVCFLPAFRAADLRYYDLTSLVYLSTDIVVADLSEDPQQQFTGTVRETLRGALHPGDKLTRLTSLLSSFSPMRDGMHVILFLDSRPQPDDFLYGNSGKPPFVIVPSGVYLIDEYGHVHAYSQTDNPGPYVAWGYGSELARKIPTKEEDLAFPSLDEEKSQIAKALRSVGAVRWLLKKTTTRADVPALLDLIDSSPSRSDRCDLRQASAIHDRVLERLHSLNDPGILLQMHALAGDAQGWQASYNFVESGGELHDNAFAAARIRFLVAQLADHENDLKTRLSAEEILLGVKSSGIDHRAFASSAKTLLAVCRAIFDDELQDSNLRGLCLQFFPDQPAKIAEVRRVFARTRSATLKFLIEGWFLGQSDDLYETLHASGGPAASIILPIRSCNASGCCACGEKPADKPVFLVEYNMRKNLFDDYIGGKRDVDEGLVVIDLHSRRRFELDEPDLITYSNAGEVGWKEFSITDLKDIPPGDYMLSYSYRREKHVVSAGFGTPVSVRHTPAGNQLVVNSKTYAEIPKGWGR
ncbi:MAG: hypothetical protein WBQ94_15095 [Terracidiphilus sp.]